mmetsp:Transcript_31475/g.45303  ORF Transcript_31475/g.45303 Transcript_31475/m.45303 type:complete len:879 (+) Transcript_31475:10-2646(+)
MPEAPPKGIHPIFLRGVTCDKFGLKTGEGVLELVDYIDLKKEDVMKEIQVMGVMSDFEPAKKIIDSITGDKILIITDKGQKYGETFLICYTEDARNDYLKGILEAQQAIELQRLEELRLEEERKIAEHARLNVVYEDKPITPRPWVHMTQADTDNEIRQLSFAPARDLISIEISRPKRYTKQSFKFADRNADAAGVIEFRAYKDPHFKAIKEGDIGIQVAPLCSSSNAQTSWYRSVQKAVQYESATISETESKDNMLSFLEKAVLEIENALQQNESVDIFSETFRLNGDDDINEGALAENELREVKNFADPTYSKFKVLSAIDWMPHAQGMVAVSAVRNVTFDMRIPLMGQTNTSYILLWDFRLLVKPLILLQSQQEIFAFRFNKTDSKMLAGGCITGQVMLWEAGDAIKSALHRNNRGTSSSSSGNQSAAAGGAADNNQVDDEAAAAPLAPKYVSSVDHSHKKCVADLFWLPPTTQINYRGQLVGDEHLDGHSYQFVTVAGDGMLMVWDIRFEQIFNDELRHIGRTKHIPTEKSSTKDGGGVKPLWAPIFKAHLKRLEGVGELSLCKVCETANAKNSPFSFNNKSAITTGDSRSQFMIATEEGDIIFADLSIRKTEATNKEKEDEEDEDAEFSCVKWIAVDHPRPSVYLQESPFFPQILLSVSDWSFNLWKLGESKPLFCSPLANTYLTAGAWSLTRPAVLYVACSDGQILVWDFTDSSFNPSISLKATHSKITSMEFLSSSSQLSHAGARQQLLAVGDEVGTLHIFEVPRNLSRPVHKEESLMLKFLERELQRMESLADDPIVPAVDAAADALQLESDNNRSTEVDHLNSSGMVPEEFAKANKAMLAKEEEEFLKLESIFITELSISGDQLPNFFK